MIFQAPPRRPSLGEYHSHKEPSILTDASSGLRSSNSSGVGARNHFPFKARPTMTHKSMDCHLLVVAPQDSTILLLP